MTGYWYTIWKITIASVVLSFLGVLFLVIVEDNVVQAYHQESSCSDHGGFKGSWTTEGANICSAGSQTFGSWKYTTVQRPTSECVSGRRNIKYRTITCDRCASFVSCNDGSSTSRWISCNDIDLVDLACEPTNRNPPGGGFYNPTPTPSTSTYTCNSKCTSCRSTSNCCSSQTNRCPSTNPVLTASNITTDSVQLSWTRSTNANKYQVQSRYQVRLNDGGVAWTNRWTFRGGTTTLTRKTLTNLAQGTTYQFRVRAQKDRYTTYRYSNTPTITTNSITSPTISASNFQIADNSKNTSGDAILNIAYTSPYANRIDEIRITTSDVALNTDRAQSSFVSLFTPKKVYAKDMGGDPSDFHRTRGGKDDSNTHTVTIQTRGNTQGVYNYQLKPTDYNKSLTIQIRSQQNNVWSNWSASTTLTTPQYPHPKAQFTIQDLNSNNVSQTGIQNTNTPRINQHLRLIYTNPTQRIQNLNYNWVFSPTQPRFHNGTSSTSASPVISFSTGGTKNIQLIVNDTNISTDNTKNNCFTTKSIYIPDPSATPTKLNAPNITTTNPALALTRQCAPVIPIGYSSNNRYGRIDRLTIQDSSNAPVYTTYYRDTEPGFHIFQIPATVFTPNTQYTALITSETDTGQDPTTTPPNNTVSDSGTLSFTAPSNLSAPTSNFSYTIQDNTIYLTNASSASHFWTIPTDCSFVQRTLQSSASPVIRCATHSTKLISLTTTHNNLSCNKSQTINLTPSSSDTRIEQVVPIY